MPLPKELTPFRTRRIPIPSYIEDDDISLHYVFQAGQVWSEHIHEDHQIIIAAESGETCEIAWRTKTGIKRTVTVPGQNIIYIRADTPHAFKTGTSGAIISLGVSQALARRITMGNLWEDVRITPCWRTYRHDIFLFGLVDVLCELCHEREEPNSIDLDLDLEPMARLLASRLLKLERERKAIIAQGLTPLQLQRVDGYITAHMRESLTVESLARAAGLKKDHFAHLFKTSTGLTPHCYVLGRRIRHAQNLRKTSTLSLADVAMEAGFCDQSHLGRCIKTYCFHDAKFFRRNIPVTAGTSNTKTK